MIIAYTILGLTFTGALAMMNELHKFRINNSNTEPYRGSGRKEDD